MRRVNVLLILIVVLAFFLRFYRVTDIPPSLNWDEVSIGYNAYSVLKTGKDEWNQSFPVHFKAYGEYKLPAQIYASIPGIAIFGLNELGVRITPVVYGTLTVLLMFFLGRALSGNAMVGLGSAFLLAISPWHIHLTRASFESSFATMWVVLGVWWLIKGLSDGKWFILSMIPFAVSIFTYNSARVFTPIFLIVVVLLFYKHFIKAKKVIFFAILFMVVLLLPLVPYYLNGDGNSRYKLVSVTDDPGLVLRVNEHRGSSNLPNPLPRLVHNKVTYATMAVVSNYLAHFSPNFLFISGAPHRQHHVQGIGEMYLFQLPLVLLGLYFLYKGKNKYRHLLISWILIGVIPVSVTNDSIPHALRTLIVAPSYTIISAYGLYALFEIVKNYRKGRLFTGILTVFIVILSVALYLQNYYQNYAKNYSKDWQYGYKQVVNFISQHQGEYDEIVFSRSYGEPHMFTAFFLNYDPAKYQSDPGMVRYETNNWVWVLKYDKFYFPDLGDKGTRFEDIVAQNPHKKLLFIGKQGDFPQSPTRLLTVDFLNGNKDFEIVEVK